MNFYICLSVHAHKVFYNLYTDIILSWSHHQIMKIYKLSRYWHFEEHDGMLNCTLRSLFLKDELIFQIEAGMTSRLQEFFNKQLYESAFKAVDKKLLQVPTICFSI